MDLGNNTYDFLFQTGGNLQSGNAPQSSGGLTMQNGSNSQAGSNSGASKQDFLGSGTVVGQVNYNPGNSSSQQPNTAENESAQASWVDPALFSLILVVVLIFGYMARKIIKEN